MKIKIVFAVLGFLLVMNTVQAIKEVETHCDLFDCYTILSIPKPLPLKDQGKTFNVDFRSKKLSNTGLDLEMNFRSGIKKFKDMNVQVLDANTIRISGKIEGASKNQWGLKIGDDDSFYNTTWWNSSYPFRYKINNFYSDTLYSVFSINDTGGISQNKDLLWAYLNNQSYLYCMNLTCLTGDFTIADNTTEKAWENNTLYQTGHNPTTVWDSDYFSVHHMEEVGLKDSTSNNRDAVNINGTPLVVDGVFGKGNYFSGRLNFYKIPNDYYFLTGDSNFTIEYWINVSKIDPEGNGIDTITAFKGNAWLYIGVANTTSPQIFRAVTERSGCNDDMRTPPIELNKWYHLALVLTKNNPVNDTLRFYLNGTLVHYDNDACTPFITLTQESFICDWNGQERGCYVSLDELRIINKALTPDEIQMRFLNGLGLLTGIGDEEGYVPPTTTTTTIPPPSQDVDVIVEFPDIDKGETFCLDNMTKARNTSQEFYGLNTSSSYTIVKEKCNYGCDSVTGECYPDPYSLNMNFLLIFGGMFIILVFLFILKKRK